MFKSGGERIVSIMSQVYIAIRVIEDTCASERSELVATTTESGEKNAMLTLAAALYDEVKVSLLRGFADKGKRRDN